jgi:dipeptidyl aminopeptidase/acylaminoacyl peptidase
MTAAPVLAQGPSRAFTVEDLVQLNRVSDPEVSPDGHYVAFALRETDMAANKGRTALWLLDLTRAGAAAQPLAAGSGNASSPRWAPDSRTIYFLSTRSGSSQVWRVLVQGGEAGRVTDYPLDVGSLKVSPRGDVIAVSLQVLPACADLACTRQKLEARKQDKATGRVYDQLFVRHWDTWADGRSHVFTARLAADGTAGPPVDLSRSLDADVPSKPFGGDEDYAFSPDGSHLVLSARIAGRTEPWSTNFDLFEVAADGSTPPVNLTSGNPALDAQPVFLKNGDLAWLAAQRPGFESDRQQVMLRDARTGAVRALTASWDRSVSRLGVTPDGRNLLATVDEEGQKPLYSIDVKTGKPARLVSQGEVEDYSAAGGALVYSWSSLGTPADLYLLPARGGPGKPLTAVNREQLATAKLSDFEQFSFQGWNGETVHGYVVKPYGYEPGKRFPVAFVIHGGPQSALANLWHYRWNAQAFAGAGYGVVMIDFHGTPGYGQAFTDSISRDWGGKPLEDLQKGLAAVLAQHPWLDGERACALGGSYGGFMINWIAGKWPGRFRCLVNHDGIFDQRMMYYTTEELWFPEWENGAPEYTDPKAYEKFNPVDWVQAWRTPMLVIHGGQDFRVPDSQGLATFTALQRLGLESRLLYFPDENHWVLKPANSVLWYHTVIGWLDDHLKKP